MRTYKYKWEEIAEVSLLNDTPSTTVTIIVPARNEGANIGHLLQDITQQIYPTDLLEVIIIDDFSEDDTYEICQQFSQQHPYIKAYRLKDILPYNTPTTAYKKKAIEAAVQLAKGKLIITTDADCKLQKQWVHSIVSFYEKEQCALIAAPVGYYQEQTHFQYFQALDFCGMQAITAAMIRMKIFNMANGANLAYEKEAFLKVNGYKDIDTKASGDDMLLVYKIAKHFPGRVHFLKNRSAIVFTQPMQTLGAFLQQRFRWTSKSASYQDKRVTIILGLVYLFTISIWANAVLFLGVLIHALFFSSDITAAFFIFLPAILSLLMLIFQIICKSIIDYHFLKSAVGFFNRMDLMSTFYYSELLHLWYIPFVGTFGNILSYNWKGRKLK